MGFKTFTCVICGKEGLTKRNSYSYGDGRACREHQEAQHMAELRKNAQEAEATAKRMSNRLHPNHMTNLNPVDYVMEELDERPEINLLLNLRKYTYNYNCYTVKSLDSIFCGVQFRNSFHPHFDKIVDQLIDAKKSGEVPCYGDIIVLIGATLDELDWLSNFFDKEDIESCINVSLPKLEEFVHVIRDLVNDPKNEEFHSKYKNVRLELIDRINFYENARHDECEAKEKMDLIAKLSKVFMGYTCEENWFKEFVKEKSFEDAIRDTANLIKEHKMSMEEN